MTLRGSYCRNFNSLPLPSAEILLKNNPFLREKYLNTPYFHHMKNTVPPSSANMGRNIYLFNITSRLPLSFLSGLFCAALDPDTNFHFDADPDPDPDPERYQNYANLHTDPSPSLKHVVNHNFFTFSHAIANLQCFIFLISVKGITIFRILARIFKFPAKQYSLSTFSSVLNYTDLDPAK
jgi:hypothetical protein